jgi:uncharacterized protein
VTRDALLDTGPLVALLDRGESMHQWARERFQEMAAPLITCEAVLSEAVFLLKCHPSAIDWMRTWIDEKILTVESLKKVGLVRAFSLIYQYRNLPMSLADACLVVMIEQGIGKRVLTLDEHFRAYRHSGRRRVPVIMPAGK